MLDQFHLKLGCPWLRFMELVPLVSHKCLNFPFDNEIFTTHYSGFNHVSFHRNFSLDFFWLEPKETIKPCEDLFLKSYQKFQA
jgi:hypothetical protein